MKVIFLDVDGVITSARDNGFEDFNINVVHWLRYLCESSEARIVISSTWRQFTTHEFWKTIFGDVIHDDWRTPDRTRKSEGGIWISSIRGDDIEAWLEQNPSVTEYVILDDDSDFHEHQKPHHIKTDGMNGMLIESLMDLRERLKVAGFPKRDKLLYQHPNMFGVTRRS